MNSKKQNNVESLDDTMVFDVENKDTKEINVIKEKSLVVDFTSPVDVLSDEDDKKTKKSKNNKKNKKLKFKPLAKLKDWWSGLSKLKKIIVCTITVLVLVLIVLLIIIFTKKDNNNNEKLPDVVIEKENYTYKNGTLILIGEDKKEIGKYSCTNKDEKKCFVAFKSNEDDFIGDIYLNEDGSKLETRLPIINNDYVFIVDNKKASNDEIILYNIKTKKNLGEYKLAKTSSINKNIVVLKDEDNKYGVLDLSEKEPKTLINFVYDYVGLASTDMASKYVVVSRNNKNYIADFTENILSSGFNEKIVDYNDNFVVTRSSESVYKIYNYEGRELTPNNYLFVKISGNYFAALQDNGIVVYDKEGNKYNEVPIGLTSTNYNRTYVFDANKQIISNEVAFEMEVNEEYISITRGKANDLLSIKDGIANKERPFVNYFNGILYFYSDTRKESLIGKYVCKNKNTVEMLDHCTIASSSNISKNDISYDIQTGIVAILNNRFVFINDTVTTPNIYLYDLSVNKKLGPYQMIETAGLVSSNFDSKNGEGSYVIAKNTKDMYGLLRINADSVDIVLNFEYSEIEKAGDNFIARKSNGKYFVFNRSAAEIVKDVPDKIMSFNDKYVAAKSALGYKVYNTQGKEIDPKTYTYVKLDKKYYVAIVDNRLLEVHEYEKAEPINFGKQINIKSSDSWKSANYYKIENLGNLYKVTITDGVNDAEYTSVNETINNSLNQNSVAVDQSENKTGEEGI